MLIAIKQCYWLSVRGRIHLMRLKDKHGPVYWQFCKGQFPAGTNYTTNHVLPQLYGTQGPHLRSQAYDTLADNAVGQNTIFFFRVCRSVYLHAFNWINQL